MKNIEFKIVFSSIWGADIWYLLLVQPPAELAGICRDKMHNKAALK